MSDSVDNGSLSDVLAQLEADVDALQSVVLTSTTDEELLAAQRQLERIRRKLAPADYRLISGTASRGIPDRHGCRSTGRFLRHLLTIDPGEANARAKAAEAAGPRKSLIGEVLPPVFEHVAAAQQSGAISQRHALLIEKTVDQLPHAVAAESGERVERDLVKYAHDFDPRQLAALARRMVHHLDPDGKLSEPADHQRRRGFTLRMRADGSSSGRFEATPEYTARMLAFFDIYARPAPPTTAG